MSIDRNKFLESFAQNTPGLKLIILNHLGAPAKLLTDISTIEMLSDKNTTSGFISYCKSHPLVKDLVLSPQYRSTNILVEFLDGSEMNFSLIRNMVRNSMVCLDVDAIKKSAYINEFGMLVPAREHHFEYMVLKCQFKKDPLSDRYRNYFATFEFNSRAKIFKYIQTRFNLIFNTLEDLYTPNAKMLLTLLIGLRAEQKNTLLKMFLRSVELGVFNLFGWITKKPIHLQASATPASQLPSREQKRSAGQAVL